MALSEKNKRKQHGGSPRQQRTHIYEFFARKTDEPLADAFDSKGVVHPFVGMTPVPEARWEEIWGTIAATPRSGKSVAYIHVPFCENHCLFCGFYQNPWRQEIGPDYTDAVVSDLRRDRDRTYQKDGPVHAVYFGGGTPSALTPTQLRKMLEAVRDNLPLAPDCEITVEGRIHNFTDDKAKACFDGGANRLSIGVQSFNDKIRRRMGRKAGRAETVRFLERLVRFDQAAIVVDLIYGFPDQDLDDWANDVKTAIETGIHGVDLYALNLNPSTPLVPAIEKGKINPAAPMNRKGAYYARGSEILHQSRWDSISNTHWRRSTRERNLYNLLIKSGANCLAYGSGAGGFLNGYSFRVDGDLKSYMDTVPSGGKPISFMMRQTGQVALFNGIKGQMEQGRLNLAWLSRELENHWRGDIAPLINQWCDAGLSTLDGDWMDLTLAGRFWQVTLTVNLLEWIKLSLDRPRAA